MSNVKMKRVKQKVLFIAFAIAMTGCSTTEPRLPVGVYRENSSSNFIDVSTNKIRVHIEGVDTTNGSGTGMEFEYVLWPSGRLFLMASRSAELLYGYPALKYRWANGNIVASNSKLDRKWEFAREEPVKPSGSLDAAATSNDGNAQR